MDKNLGGGGVPKHPMAGIRLITQMENPLPGESCAANSLPLGQYKVVNPPSYLGGPSQFHLIAPLLHKRNFPGKPGRARNKFYLKRLKP